MQQHFPQAVARIDDRGQVCCVLTSRQNSSSEQVFGAVQQMLIIRTFWLPRRGRTPLSPSGSNANIEYLVETGGQTALYRGAGFATLDKATSKKNFTLDLRSAQIRLDRHTTGFKPSFTAAELTGETGVKNNPAVAETLMEDFDRKFQNLRR